MQKPPNTHSTCSTRLSAHTFLVRMTKTVPTAAWAWQQEAWKAVSVRCMVLCDPSVMCGCLI